MKKRPLIFIILGIIHLLEPLSKILYLKIETGFSFSKVLENILAIEGLRTNFEFWFLFPIAGIALLTIKKWSYPVFVAVQFYSLISHLSYEEYTWPYVSEVPILSSLILLIFNIGMIVYFALPSVRRPFLDKTIRWWETYKRYAVNIPCEFIALKNSSSFKGEILNISKSGVFATCNNNEVHINDELKVRFHFYNLNFSLKAIIVSKHSYTDKTGWGIQFEFNDWREKFNLSRLINILKLAYKNPY